MIDGFVENFGPMVETVCLALLAVLGDGIPATSFAAGANAFESNSGIRNINMRDYMSNVGIWPSSKKEGSICLWEHSDLKNLSYFYVFSFFQSVVDEN